MLKNLGKIERDLNALAMVGCAMHADVDAMHAPSECHGDVARGQIKRAIEIVEEWEKLTGYTAMEIHDELLARCSHKWLHYRSGALEVLGNVLEHRERAELCRQHKRWYYRSKLI